ncbi:hypothetical protein BDV19DRAFT_244292 [Aspergillus venezuelensis]
MGRRRRNETLQGPRNSNKGLSRLKHNKENSALGSERQRRSFPSAVYPEYIVSTGWYDLPQDRT